MRRHLVLLFAVTLGVLLSGCGSADRPGTPATAEGAQPPAAAGVEPPAPGAVVAENAATSEPPSLAPGTRLTGVRGRVERVSDEWWGIVPDFDEGTRFAPDPPLAPELRREGLLVVFSGTVGEIPPNVRMWGLPLAVDGIRPSE
jgi:hypothetical protein